MPGLRPRLLAAAALACLARDAVAEQGIGDWVAADEAVLRLVSTVSAVPPGQARILVGLHVRLAEAWRIYWRTPGAAGLPPEFDWTGSSNLAGAIPHWPAPRRFEAFGLQSYGYTGEVIFPVTASLVRPGEPVALRLTWRYLVCREVCMPGEAELSLDLDAGHAAQTSAAAPIAHALARVPARAEASGVAVLARSGPEGLAVTARSAAPFVAPDLFLEWQVGPGRRRPDLPKPAVTLHNGGREAEFRLPIQAVLLPPGTRLAVTIADADAAFEAEVTVEPQPR
jgi:suppressor for copper-sensitivity B